MSKDVYSSQVCKVTIDSKLSDVLKLSNEAISDGLTACGELAEGYAKDLCPVRTGNLRNSLTHQHYDELSEEIGSAVNYAPYVELGTVRIKKGKPYLKPALVNHTSEYAKVFEKILKQNVG